MNLFLMYNLFRYFADYFLRTLLLKRWWRCVYSLFGIYLVFFTCYDLFTLWKAKIHLFIILWRLKLLLNWLIIYFLWQNFAFDCILLYNLWKLIKLDHLSFLLLLNTLKKLRMKSIFLFLCLHLNIFLLFLILSLHMKCLIDRIFYSWLLNIILLTFYIFDLLNLRLLVYL